MMHLHVIRITRAPTIIPQKLQQQKNNKPRKITENQLDSSPPEQQIKPSQQSYTLNSANSAPHSSPHRH